MKRIPGHWKKLSDACWDDGVGCDGAEYDGGGAVVGGCDCPCHGDSAPFFATNEDVRIWHKTGRE